MRMCVFVYERVEKRGRNKHATPADELSVQRDRTISNNATCSCQRGWVWVGFFLSYICQSMYLSFSFSRSFCLSLVVVLGSNSSGCLSLLLPIVMVHRKRLLLLLRLLTTYYRYHYVFWSPDSTPLGLGIPLICSLSCAHQYKMWKTNSVLSCWRYRCWS